MRTVWDVIKSPVITEKALVAKEETQDKRQLLTFRVGLRATKPEIKQAVELSIRSKIPDVLSPEYRITLAERDIRSKQFPWTLQKLLYDCLTDYVVELFTKSPMTG